MSTINHKNTKASDLDDKTIKEWKAKYGDLYEVEVKDEEGNNETVILRLARRNEIGAASVSAKSNPSKFTEYILRACWLAGDQDKVFASDAMLNAMSEHIEALIPVAESKIKKL